MKSQSTIWWKLKALGNACSRLERLSATGASITVIEQNRFDVIRQMANLCAEALGAQKDFVRGKRSDIQYIRLVLSAWAPIFPDDFDNGGPWATFKDELARLEYGDEPTLLKPAPRRRGQHKQQAQLLKHRIEALQWAEFLKANGVKPKQFRPIIEEVYLATWDTIRKWRSLADDAIGSDTVDWWLDNARHGYEEAFALDDWQWRVFESGERYRGIVGLNPLNPNDFSSFLEKQLP